MDFANRLNSYLGSKGLPTAVQTLTPDASTREYFRIAWNDSSAIACVYPEPFIATEQSYLDVTGLFRRNGLPVADIYDFDESLGVIIQEDLGNTILRDVLLDSDEKERELLLNEAISLIAQIHTATEDAFSSGSIAGKLRFDVEKLVWELEFFQTHYFETFRKHTLSPTETAMLKTEFLELAAELEGHASVLCHRDFHAANLMLDRNNNTRIIDHQDARMGSPAYDLVSLLLDRVTVQPSEEWLREKMMLLLSERERRGLAAIELNDYAYQFGLQTVQRCLKAVGTFSFQSVNRGKTYFIPYIMPSLEIVLNVLEKTGRFPHLHEILAREEKYAS
jgi:aminoglycoside/choline kinase family phosphotransferase